MYRKEAPAGAFFPFGKSAYKLGRNTVYYPIKKNNSQNSDAQRILAVCFCPACKGDFLFFPKKYLRNMKVPIFFLENMV